MAIYLGLIVCDPSIQQKLHENHNITLEDVRDALQWPALAQAVQDDDPEHGWRVVALGTASNGHQVFAALLPVPFYEGINADTWLLKTAIWL